MVDDLLDTNDDYLSMSICPDNPIEDLLAWDETEETPYPKSETHVNTVDPNTLVDEVNKLKRLGQDPIRMESVVEVLNKSASELFHYWLDKYNRKPDYVSRTLAIGSLNCMRVNALTMPVTANDGSSLVDGNVVGATPDGKKVKLLFMLAPNQSQRQYANCMSLKQAGAYWFDVNTGKPNTQIPFYIAPVN